MDEVGRVVGLAVLFELERVLAVKDAWLIESSTPSAVVPALSKTSTRRTLDAQVPLPCERAGTVLDNDGLDLHRAARSRRLERDAQSIAFLHTARRCRAGDGDRLDERRPFWVRGPVEKDLAHTLGRCVDLSRRPDRVRRFVDYFSTAHP